MLVLTAVVYRLIRVFIGYIKRPLHEWCDDYNFINWLDVQIIWPSLIFYFFGLIRRKAKSDDDLLATDGGKKKRQRRLEVGIKIFVPDFSQASITVPETSTSLD